MSEDLVICRCQEITQSEIEEAVQNNDLRYMKEVKRLTRAVKRRLMRRRSGGTWARSNFPR